jgi:predicted nucleic acid-binding protein
MRAALDTNVLVYAEGFGDRPRVERSRSLLQALAKADVVIPLQCLGELYRVLTAKARREAAASREAVLGWMDSYPVRDGPWRGASPRQLGCAGAERCRRCWGAAADQ